MADQSIHQEFVRAGQNLDQSLRRYQAFVDKTVRKYVDASKGGRVNYVAAIISREQERLNLVVDSTFRYKSLNPEPLDKSQWDALTERKALYEDLSAFFDPQSHHQLELQKALSGEDGLTKSERNRLKRDAPKLSGLIDQFGAAFVAADSARNAPDQRARASDDLETHSPITQNRRQSDGR